MNDRAVALLEQYEIEVLRTRKGRGAILCDTQQGCLIFKEYTGREEQLRLQEQVLKHLEERGTVPAERLLATKEGALSFTWAGTTNSLSAKPFCICSSVNALRKIAA